MKDYSKYFKLPKLAEARKRLNKDNIIKEYEIKEELLTLGKGYKYFIITHGCQGNEADSEKIRGILESMSFEETLDEKEADLVVFNTCAIRENAEEKVYGELGRFKEYKRNNENLVIALCGCMAQEEKVINRIRKTYNYVDIVFGTHKIDVLPSLLEETYINKHKVIDVLSYEGDIVENIPVKRMSNIKAWVNIMYGCDEFCTYCIVPYTRGKERSRRPENIIEEVKELAKEGYKEVTLLGQNVNAYGKDFLDIKYSFADLLSDLSKIDIPRIRFVTSHPKDFDDDLIDVLARGGNLMPYIHLPVQSGSSKVLKKMNRKYTREEYIILVDKIKAKIPNVSLTTDIIVGFPYETEEDFQETLSLIEYVKFEGAYTFIFSKREGTPAASFVDDTITKEVASNRLHRLNDVVNKYYLEGNKRFEGKTVLVLVEGNSKNKDDMLMGYTENNKLVNFKGDKSLIGSIVKVKITEAKTWSLDGELE